MSYNDKNILNLFSVYGFKVGLFCFDFVTIMICFSNLLYQLCLCYECFPCSRVSVSVYVNQIPNDVGFSEVTWL